MENKAAATAIVAEVLKDSKSMSTNFEGGVAQE